MDNKVLGLIIGGIIAAVLTVLGVVYMVTSGGDDSSPAPVTSSTPTPSETSDPLMDLLEETWDATPADKQSMLCAYYRVDPDGAFESFNDGSEGILPEETFDEFFSAECSTI